MTKTLQKIEQKLKEYREYRDKLNHDWNVAKKLGHDLELKRIEIDIQWSKSLRDDLEEIRDSLQKELKDGQ